ncbi:MAG: hypothetical protein HKN68_04565 [Saprospiraceae bacterium]|nr:hypothetical protein [Saprospiraceae bacterium]
MRGFLYLMFLSLVAVMSCKSDVNQVEAEDAIEGEWEILDALRNGRRTTTLEDGFIAFDSLGILSTNILGKTTRSNFSIEENVISSDGDFDFNFNIEKLSGDTMILSGQMRAFNMVFYLMRQDTTLTGDDINEIEEAAEGQIME